MKVQELDDTVVGKTVRIAGRRPMQVLDIAHGNNSLKRVTLHVIIDGLDRIVQIRQDTEVLEVDI